MALKGSIARSLNLLLWVVVGCSGTREASREGAGARIAERPPAAAVDPDVMVGEPPRTIAEPAAPDAPDAPGAPGAPPEVELGGRVWRVAVVSDLNSSYGKTTYRDEVHASARWIARELRPDLVLSTGDHVAGMKRGVDLDGMWAGFHAAFTDELARGGVPFAPSPGNHDASAYEAYSHERERFGAEWSARRPDVRFVDDAHYPFRYAFRQGPALFVALDVTVARPLSGEHLAWLEALLERERDADVKVVFGHIPLRAFVGGRKRDEVVRDQDLERVLRRAGVDAYLSGHHHAYFPGRAAGMRMVAMPCLGSGSRKLMGTDDASARGVVVLELDASGVRSVESHTSGSGFARVVPRGELPERVGQGDQEVWRDDLTPSPAIASSRPQLFTSQRAPSMLSSSTLTDPHEEAKN